MEKMETNLQKQLDSLQKKIEDRSLSKEVRLPEWPESKRATPTITALSVREWQCSP